MTWSMRAEKVPRPGRMEVAEHTITLNQKAPFDAILAQCVPFSVTFDDDHSVADAGLALVAVLSEKLDLEELARSYRFTG